MKPVKKLSTFYFLTTAFCLLTTGLFLSSCPGVSSHDSKKPKSPRFYEDSVKKAEFTGDTATIDFNNLNGHNIYLVSINQSDLVVQAEDTGGFNSPSVNYQPEKYIFTPNELILIDHPGAREFNANPPPVEKFIQKSFRSVFIPPEVGDTREFWVETVMNNNDFVKKQATLRACGLYCNVWIMDENYSVTNSDEKNVTVEQALSLADKFDLLYPLTTAILGFEYGGGPDGDGGIDGDPKIQILVYDIAVDTEDYNVVGYFWAKDYYPESPTLYSNMAEIFYINSYILNLMPETVYSALIHEFQHMINFNVKTIEQKKNSAAWYNEMLSLMTEDIISPLIGISPSNNGHPIQRRIGKFLETYNLAGIAEWGVGDDLLASYAKGYAFGAYMLRNFGGAELLQKLLANNASNIESITLALQEMDSELNFNEALRRFGEAMIFSGSNMPISSAKTFDTTVTCNISSIAYTAYGFDIWKRKQYSNNTLGPLIFNAGPMEMRPYSLLVQSLPAWKNKFGNYSITLKKPNNPNIELFLMVR